MMTRLVALALVLVVGSAQMVLAQTVTDVDNVARSELRTRKSVVMAKAMGLTEAQSEMFWPHYRQYEIEMDKLYDRDMANIRDFAANYEHMTDKKASALAKEAFAVDKSRSDLVEKTYKAMSKDLGQLLAVRFAQVDHQINTLMNLEVMRAVPLIASPEELGIAPPAQ